MRHTSVVRLLFVIALGCAPSSSFMAPSSLPTTASAVQGAADNDDAFASAQESIQSSIRIAQASSSAGSGFKQIIADVFAGDYDAADVNAQLDELIASAPCVVFIWQASPFSKKALRCLQEVAGVTNMRVVRLDDPWEAGNKMRAELGKRTGRTSVPSIWIGGAYVGGFDGGVDDDTSPGIVDLAFRGTLQPMLEAAGAFDEPTAATAQDTASEETAGTFS